MINDIQTINTQKILPLARKNYKLSENHKKKISIANTGHFVSDITKQKISKSNTGKVHTLASRLKISNSKIIWYKTHDAPMKGKKLFGDNLKRVQNLQKGVKQSKKTKLKRIETRKRNKLGKTIISKITREKMSISAVNRIMKGHNNYARGKKCYFYSKINKRKIWCMSSWEKTFYIFLETYSSIIDNYIEQPMRIPYLYMNTMHQYIPDALITYKNNKKQLIELKPMFKLKEIQTQCKLKAAKEYCIKNNIIFTLITTPIFSNLYLLQND